MKNKRLLIFTTMVCVLFVAACTKKPDKLLTMKSGMWFCDITTVTVYNVTNEPTSIVNSFSKFEFFENGTGKSGVGNYGGMNFTWEIKGQELQISIFGILPFILKSKSKNKMVWERTYNSNLDYETYTQTIELMR